MGKAISKPFEICRGVRQGDPLSPNLFNALLESVINPLQESWRRRGFGMKVGPTDRDRLCNLRFADDVILVAATKK
eukprot:5953838-Karenia_brevis.AAC.1